MRVGALFEAHGRMVHALCRMLLREREEAEDATQQTFLLAHRSLLGGVVPDQPEAWLATIARNECYRRLGRRPPDAVPLLDSDGGGGNDPSRLADQRAEIEALCEALVELPPAQRQAVVLREFYGLSYREVAAVLGVSGAAVESLLFKSRRRLQDKLRPIRAASNALILPLTLRDSLAAAIPGFSGAASGGAGAAAGGALLGKLASAPLAAKLAAVVVAAGTGTGVTVAEMRHSSGASADYAGLDLRVERQQPEPSAATPPRVERSAPSAAGEDDDDDEGDGRDEDERDEDERDEDDEHADDDERDEASGGDDDEREERAQRKEKTRTGSASEREQPDDEDEPERSGTRQAEEPERDEDVGEAEEDTDDD